MNGERLHNMVRKEFIQTFRDPRMKRVIFLMPILQLLIFAHAVNTDIDHVALGIWDLDQTPQSRELVASFIGSRYFDQSATVATGAEADAAIDRGDAQAILYLRRGFGQDIAAGRTAMAQLILDGSDSNTAAIVLQYGARVTARYSTIILESRMRHQLGMLPEMAKVELQSRAWFNENLSSRIYFIPGIIALLVTLITLMLTSMAIVREKEIGTMEQLMVTPLTPWEIILGKTIPFAMVAFIDMFLVSLVGVLWFSLPVRGSLLLLAGATAVYFLSSLGVGLLISTLSQTQQQAVLSTFFFLLPAMMLSGFAFPVANMPKIIQWLTIVNPLRHYLLIMRSVFLKGSGFAILWPEMAILLAIGLTMFLIASRRFKKTLA